jgi:predicted DNA-binding transcriptional regulator YafY
VQPHAWEIGGDDEAPVRAVVRIDADQAPWVRRVLGEEAVVAAHDDGGVDVAVEVSNHDAFRSWVLGFLDHAEVLEPPELRDELVTRLRQLAR